MRWAGGGRFTISALLVGALLFGAEPAAAWTTGGEKDDESTQEERVCGSPLFIMMVGAVYGAQCGWVGLCSCTSFLGQDIYECFTSRLLFYFEK